MKKKKAGQKTVLPMARAEKIELGLVLRTGKLMLFYQLERKFNETYPPSYITEVWL